MSTVYLAFFRALESNRPIGKRLFHDPYARLFLPAYFRFWAWISVYPFFSWFVPWYIEKRWPGALTAVVARTRLIDVMTVQAIENHGVNQVIILGAGYDTRPYRLTRQRVQFVEVDRPPTQQYKRQLLSQVPGLSTKPVDYVPLDFFSQQPSSVIPAHLLQEYYKTLIIWESATNNLTSSLGDTLFKYFQGYPSGTRVIFTYVDKQVLENPRSFFGAGNIANVLRNINEQWNIALEPASLQDFLASYNMELLYNMNSTEYRHLYFGKRADKMKGYEFYWVAMAKVK